MPRDKFTDLERFFAKVTISDCWWWDAGQTKTGYGKFNAPVDGKMRCVRAHRWLYQVLVGPVPRERDIDHLCRNRLCVNPDHLEPVSRSINLARGVGGYLLAQWWVRERAAA